MKDIVILCAASFSPSDRVSIDAISEELNISREEVIKKAVSFFADQCVTTHSDSKRETA